MDLRRLSVVAATNAAVAIPVRIRLPIAAQELIGPIPV